MLVILCSINRKFANNSETVLLLPNICLTYSYISKKFRQAKTILNRKRVAKEQYIPQVSKLLIPMKVIHFEWSTLLLHYNSTSSSPKLKQKHWTYNPYSCFLLVCCCDTLSNYFHVLIQSWYYQKCCFDCTSLISVPNQSTNSKFC